MSFQAPTQSTDSISQRYAAERFLDAQPAYVAARAARLEADTAAYKAERRIKAIRRYLRERAARKEA